MQAVSSPGLELEEVARRENIEVHAIPMARRVTPLRDLGALIKMVRLFRVVKPTVVHAHTPKGGLLGVLGACLAGVPVIFYTIHGLPFATASGFRRWVLYLSEWLACRGAHQILAVSKANMQLAISKGLCPKGKIDIIASGSVSGVDVEGRFNPARLSHGVREKIRNFYKIPESALVIGYVGRIVRDKGITELAAVWQQLRRRHPDLYLFLIGPEEPHDPIPRKTKEVLEADARVIFTGSMREPEELYTAMDILVLPTYREGFPIVPLEAAAMQLPVVATWVDGCREAVINGITGLLVPPKDTEKLAAALEVLIKDPDLRKLMGMAGRERVLREFKPENIWKSLYGKYIELINKKGILEKGPC